MNIWRGYDYVIFFLERSHQKLKLFIEFPYNKTIFKENHV